jgi:hypothetical protein
MGNYQHQGTYQQRQQAQSNNIGMQNFTQASHLGQSLGNPLAGTNT